MGIVSGKKALVLGIANERSLACAIARQLAQEGAALAVTYQGEALEERVRKLAPELQARVVLPCDVTSDAEIERTVQTAGSELGGLDILVHAIAYAGRDALSGAYSAVTRQDFLQAMDISVYSFTALARAAAPLMLRLSAAFSLTCPSTVLKSRTPLAESVFTGPAEMALTRIRCGPRSTAR